MPEAMIPTGSAGLGPKEDVMSKALDSKKNI